MRSEASSDVFKVWLYAAAVVLLGAWTAPLLYNAGKAIAEICATKQTNGPLEWLAGICQRTGFPGFFEASLAVFAVVLFLPFMRWLRGGQAGAGGNPWSFRLPENARARTAGQRLASNPRGTRQGVTGFLLVTALFLMIAGVMVLAGVFEWKSPGESVPKLVLRAFAAALGLAVLQEILFRGIAMGIFLRAMRPAAALGMSAVLFALVHFLNPPPGLHVADPDAAGVGFELLRKIAGQFSEPRVVLGTFTPLLALGGVLAYARWRTASLCLPIGLHAGWIFTNMILGGVTMAASRPDSILWVISGASPTQGLVPLAGILIAGVLSSYLTTPADDTDTPA
jgi:membrane protease YdiL (CAAX protease family)